MYLIVKGVLPTMKRKILDMLKESRNEFVSGQYISDELGISREAVHKYMNQIKNEGYTVEAVSRKGYRLVSVPDLLTYEEIKKNLHTKYMGRKIVYFDTIDSTNIKAKALAASGESEGTVVIAETQVFGRGRLGKNWTSPKYKGIWMSVILKPDIEPVHAAKVTLAGAAAVQKTMMNMGIHSKIKWPNDLVLNNKKICGILTEMNCELNKINYIIIGSGINVNIDTCDFTEEIRNTATSLKIETGKTFSRQEIAADIMNNFEMFYDEFKNEGSIKHSVELCRENSALLGEDIKIINAGKETKAKALDINDKGELVVKYEDGKIGNIIAGEVSTRGLYGYV